MSKFWNPLGVVMGCALAFSLSVPASAVAGSGWAAPVVLSHSGGPFGLTFDVEGDALLAWLEGPPGEASVSRAVEHPAGGEWKDVPGPAVPERMIVDRQGDVIAVGEHGLGVNHGVMEADLRPADANAWDVPVQLGPEEGGWSGEGQVAFALPGEAVAIWGRVSNGRYTVEAAARSPLSGLWSPAIQLSAPGSFAVAPQLIGDEHGSAMAFWDSCAGGAWKECAIVTESYSAVAGAWGKVSVLPGAEGVATGYATFHVASDSAGDIFALWRRAGEQRNTIEVAERPASSRKWRAPVLLGEQLGMNATPEDGLGVDAAGDAVAVWEGTAAGHGVVESSIRSSADGKWQTAVILGEGLCSHPSLAVGSAGHAVAVFECFDSSTSDWKLYGAVRLPGETWQPPVQLAAGGEYGYSPQVAVNSDGDAVAVWRETQSKESLIEASGYKSGLSGSEDTPIPPSGVTRQPPVIRSASMTHRRFRVGRGTTAAVARRVAIGTRFRFALSVRASVTISIARSAPGLRRGHSCVRPIPALRREHAKACVRRIASGTLTRASEPKGFDSIAFSGRIGRRALRSGRYTALIRANNSQGFSRPASLSFTVLA
jgi:hypothetical protein